MSCRRANAGRDDRRAPPPAGRRRRLTSWLLMVGVGEVATFFVLAGLCVVSYIWIHRNVPETRGRTLEEIQELWNPSTTRPPAAPTTDP